MQLDAARIEALFTREDRQFFFSRWGRPLAPIVFGVEDATLEVIKGALEAVCIMAGHTMAETDPELGANYMWFFLRDWSELTEVPGLDRLVPDLGPLVGRLREADANQYRIFRFDEAGAIQACFVFLRMDEQLSAVPAEVLALNQVVQSMVVWSDLAFRDRSPLALAGERTVLHPEIGALLRACYDPAIPVHSEDASLALRLAARVRLAGQ